MADQTWTHRKILLLSAVTALLSSLVIAVLKEGVTPAQFLSWSFSTFALTYPTLLAGRSGSSCRSRASRAPR
jgi:hypothetical protein